MKPIKTIFFGTPEFAVPCLKALVGHARFEVVAVVTQPDMPVGRKRTITPPPVKVAALEFGLPVLQPEKLKDEAVGQLSALGAELAVVVAYGNLIPKALIAALPKGFVNIHPSLLPKHRGASPISAAILAGDQETGVCLMVLDELMDHGPIIACRKVALNDDETTVSLRQRLAPIGASMLEKELVEYLDGRLTPQEQDHDRATFCKLVNSEDARIDWSKPVKAIERQVRAMNGLEPAWTMLHQWSEREISGLSANPMGRIPTTNDLKLFIHRATAISGRPAEEAGTMTLKDKALAIAGSDGYLLVDEIQPSGGKPMAGQAYLNGHQGLLGKTLS